MPGSVNISEARAQPVLSPDVDFAACVIGFASESPLPEGQVSAQYSDPTTLASDYGIGDGVDLATHAITKTDGNPAPPPIAICPVPDTTPGTMGTVDTTGSTGTAANVGLTGSTATITATSGAEPKMTLQLVGRVVDDGNNGLGRAIGDPGIILEFSPDDARTFLPRTALGSATVKAVELPGGIATGASFTFGPTTTTSAFIAAAVDARASTLDHLANLGTHHDSDDTSTEQVALAASAVPTTVAAALSVYALCAAAFTAHLPNIDVHAGPDPVNVITQEMPTDLASGVVFAAHYKAKFNAHLGIALAASAAGLKAATATVTSPVTLTTADLISGGVTALDLYPRRLTFTTAGVTPANAPDTADIAGNDYAEAAQTEDDFAIAQTAALVATDLAYRGTGLSIAYAAGQGTAATVAIGYGAGVHNSADTDNLITAADPTSGLLKTGDTWRSVTTPPVAAVGDLYTAGDEPSGAFAAIAQSSTEFGLIVLEQPLSATNFATVVAGLNYGATQGKDWTLLARFRDPAEDETDAAYVAAFQAFASAQGDSRICCVVGSGWLTDGFRGYRYLRSGLPAVLARLQSHAVIPGKLGEKLAQHPGWVQRGPLELFTITDDSGNLIGHDEQLRGGIDGPIGAVGGGLTFYRIPNPNLPGTFISDAPVLYPALSQVLLLPDRRVVNGIKRIASAILWTEIQGADIISDTSPRTLDDEIRDGMQGKVRRGIVDQYSNEIQNPSDPNLVSITPTVTVSGSRVTISGVIAARLFPYTDTINIVFSATR